MATWNGVKKACRKNPALWFLVRVEGSPDQWEALLEPQLRQRETDALKDGKSLGRAIQYDTRKTGVE
jgi:hypothetical protein